MVPGGSETWSERGGGRAWVVTCVISERERGARARMAGAREVGMLYANLGESHQSGLGFGGACYAPLAAVSMLLVGMVG